MLYTIHMESTSEHIRRIHVDVTCIKCKETIQGTQYASDDTLGWVCAECQDE